MAATHKMGGDSVVTNTLAVLFTDGTEQFTAAVTAGGGSSIIADDTGITMTDPFGGGIQTSSTFAFLGADNSGGGFAQFFDGTEWDTSVADGSGNSLLLGQGFGSNINLSNEFTTSGFINPSGSVTDIIGNPINLIGPVNMDGVAINPTAPTSGQVLTASSPTAASWQTPSAGGLVYQAQRVHVGVIASATPSAITTLTWTTPFADNNYTVVSSVSIAETPPNGAATEIITVGSMQLSASGAGLTFVVCNASSGVHDVTVNFIAIHD